MDRRAHWEEVYRAKAADQVSWFQASAEPSLRMTAAAKLSPGAAIIDVGGGASVLAGELLDRGFKNITVLDCAEAALAANRTRLGARSSTIRWITADVLSWEPDRAYDLWHDRAVFHFLTDPEDRAKYRGTVARALKPGGSLIIATFAPEGPERCSGLPVRRWSADGLANEFGPDYRLAESSHEDHRTPWGAVQAFTWCRFRRL